MFERLRNALSSRGSAADRPATRKEVARWAQEQHLNFTAQPEEGHFLLAGTLGDRPWQIQCGTPGREYVHGLELRGRADVGADPEAAVMVLNRPLHGALEGNTYDAITDTLQTTVDARLPEELRWLAIYEEMSWPALPASFRQHFAVVAERIELAQRWIHAPLVSQLLTFVEGDGGASRASTPMVLMLVRGKVYLRMEHRQRSLAELGQATKVLQIAAQAALANLPPPPASAPVPVPAAPR